MKKNLYCYFKKLIYYNIFLIQISIQMDTCGNDFNSSCSKEISWHTKLKTAISRNQNLWQGIGSGTLATIGPDGPNTRTLVVRGFYKNGEQLWFVTNGLSAKAQEIAKDPRVSLLWLFNSTAEQFRINGTMDLFQNNNLKNDPEMKDFQKKVWKEAAPHMKSWCHTDEGHNFFAEGRSDSKEPADNFCVMILSPNKVQYLNLGGEQITYTKENDNWNSNKIFG